MRKKSMTKFNTEGAEIFGYGSVEESIGQTGKTVPSLILDDNGLDC